EINIPLMVITGVNDPRVPASEADQIVTAVRAHNRPAWHLLAQNEGHGFRKKENADYQFWASLLFWQKYLLNGDKCLGLNSGSLNRSRHIACLINSRLGIQFHC